MGCLAAGIALLVHRLARAIGHVHHGEQVFVRADRGLLDWLFLLHRVELLKDLFRGSTTASMCCQMRVDCKQHIFVPEERDRRFLDHKEPIRCCLYDFSETFEFVLVVRELARLQDVFF